MQKPNTTIIFNKSIVQKLFNLKVTFPLINTEETKALTDS